MTVDLKSIENALVKEADEVQADPKPTRVPVGEPVMAHLRNVPTELRISGISPAVSGNGPLVADRGDKPMSASWTETVAAGETFVPVTLDKIKWNLHDHAGRKLAANRFHGEKMTSSP